MDGWMDGWMGLGRLAIIYVPILCSRSLFERRWHGMYMNGVAF